MLSGSTGSSSKNDGSRLPSPLVVSSDNDGSFPPLLESQSTYDGQDSGPFAEISGSAASITNHPTGTTPTQASGASITNGPSNLASALPGSWSSDTLTSMLTMEELYFEGESSRNLSKSISSLLTNSTTFPMPPIVTISLSPPSSSKNSTTTSLSTNPIESCYFSETGMPTTIVSIIHTSTITWYGDPEDYTAEFPSIDLPTPCNLFFGSEGDTGFAPTSFSAFPQPSGCGQSVSGCLGQVPPDQTHPLLTITEVASDMFSWTYTFFTTDKNPAVVFTKSTSVPDYGGEGRSNGDDSGHVSVTQTNDGDLSSPVPKYGESTDTQNPFQLQQSVSKTDIIVEVRPTEVVINTMTISNDPASPKIITVTVGTDVFTVGPSSIVGAGATVSRQAEKQNIVSPISTTINEIAIIVSKSVAVVGGTTFIVDANPLIQTVSGNEVVIGPSGVAIAGVTVSAASDSVATQVAVAGGELITAIGKSVAVIEGTSYTYGPGIEMITKVIDDDTITIGPSKIIIGETTLGGSKASHSKVVYEIVGGATITEIGASVIIIEGISYTLGSGTGTTTTVVGGETITIEPSGVIVNDGMTLTYPFGPTMTTTLRPGATVTAAEALPTNGKLDEEDSAFRVGKTPNLGLVVIFLCITLEVGFFGFPI